MGSAAFWGACATAADTRAQRRRRRTSAGDLCPPPRTIEIDSPQVHPQPWVLARAGTQPTVTVVGQARRPAAEGAPPPGSIADDLRRRALPCSTGTAPARAGGVACDVVPERAGRDVAQLEQRVLYARVGTSIHVLRISRDGSLTNLGSVAVQAGIVGLASA